MKIISAAISNYRSIEFLEMSPTSTVVKILGANATGKTSALEAILKPILGDKDAGDVIRHGEKKAEASVIVEHEGVRLRCTQKWLPSGRSVKVEEIGNDGKVVAERKNPRELLAALCGPFHDIRSILRVTNAAGERELRAALLQAAGVDVADLEKVDAELRDERREINDALRRETAKLEDMQPPADGLPAEPVSLAAKAAELEEMRAAQRRRADAEREGERMAERLAFEDAGIAKLEAQLAEARERRAQVAAAIDAHRIPEAPSDDDVRATAESLAGIEDTNRQITAAEKYRETAGYVQTLTAESESLTDKIEAAAAEKVARLAKAELPIDGLAIDDDGVTYHGERLQNLSTGQRLLVGAGIAVATRKGLEAIFCDGAEALDDAAEQALAALCEAHGVTAFLAQTTRTGGELYVQGADYRTDATA